MAGVGIRYGITNRCGISRGRSARAPHLEEEVPAVDEVEDEVELARGLRWVVGGGWVGWGGWVVLV